MALEAQAVQNVSAEINEQFETLVNLMNDISDGHIDARWGGLCRQGELEILGRDATAPVGVNGNIYGYDLAGIEIAAARGDGARRNGATGDFVRGGTGIDATAPGTMLQISTGTSNQQLFSGQLGDLVGQAKAMKNKMAQIAQR